MSVESRRAMIDMRGRGDKIREGPEKEGREVCNGRHKMSNLW